MATFIGVTAAGDPTMGGDVSGTASAATVTKFNGSTNVVTTIAGTANQVVASAATGAITLSGPQDLATGSTPTFAHLQLGGASAADVKLKKTGSAAARLYSGDEQANATLTLGTLSAVSSVLVGTVQIDSSGVIDMQTGAFMAWQDAVNVRDIGFARNAAGVLRVTNGSTGYGALAFATSVTLSAGSGSPEGAVTAAVGSLFLRTDGGAVSSVYVKESGAGNTGWVAK